MGSSQGKFDEDSMKEFEVRLTMAVSMNQLVLVSYYFTQLCHNLHSITGYDLAEPI